jgi:hypothetical protein
MKYVLIILASLFIVSCAKDENGGGTGRDNTEQEDRR